jgi:amino acid transporter
MRVFEAIHLGHRLIDKLGIAEMVTYLPISSPFIRFAGRFVDEAFGVRPHAIL